MNKHLPAFIKWNFVALLVLTFITSCQREENITPVSSLTSSYDNEIVLKWNELILDVERFTPGYLPPVSARAYAYIGLAAYETALPGMPEYKSFVNYYQGLQLPVSHRDDGYHYPAALNSAYATIIK